MRGKTTALAMLASVGLLATLFTPSAGGQSTEGKAHSDVTIAAPGSPNPFVAFLPDGVNGDYAGWTGYLNAAGKLRSGREAPGAARAGLRVREREPADTTGVNDTPATAQTIRRFGSAAGKRPAAIISGAAPVAATVDVPSPQAEEDGAIPVANGTPVANGVTAVTSGVIGDGAWGSAAAGTGDFDFFAVTGAQAGQRMIVDIDTPVPFGDLDPFVVVWNAAGVPVAANDDDGSSFDSFLVFTVPADGDYFVSIGGFGSFIPEDPFVVGSPSITGSFGSEGEYDARISLTTGDRDVYAFQGRAGDIVGAASLGAAGLAFLDGGGGLLIGSGQNLTFIHPAVSPLPGNGDVAASYVLPTDGTYYMAVDAGSAYEVELRVFRPAKERRGQGTQILFLDFDGASVNPDVFGGALFPASGDLSPLASFLGRWGLTAADEDAVIDAIVAAVEENLSSDPRLFGNNGDRDAGDGPGSFDVEIRNSRDHADPWGQQFVSRIVIGGTIDQLGIPTVGIAQSIDVGDFESEETAVVLLDLLSEDPLVDPGAPSLNAIPRAPGVSIIDLIGIGVGNIVAHEAGHFWANWHTDQFNPLASIMDQGGNLPGTIGVGPDGIFGSADDVDVDLDTDEYVPNEGFVGLEDTLNAVAFGLSTGQGRGGR